MLVQKNVTSQQKDERMILYSSCSRGHYAIIVFCDLDFISAALGPGSSLFGSWVLLGIPMVPDPIYRILGPIFSYFLGFYRKNSYLKILYSYQCLTNYFIHIITECQNLHSYMTK